MIRCSKRLSLLGKNAEYNFVDSRKTNSNMINPFPDQNGKMPNPYVKPLTDKLQLTVNLPENAISRTKPVNLKCVGTLAEDWNKNPSPSQSIFMEVNYAKQLKVKYNKLNNVKVDTSIKDSHDSASVRVASASDVSTVEQSIKDLEFILTAWKTCASRSRSK